MHPNPAFRQESADRSLDFARARGFGTLTVNSAEGPLMAHVPFLLSAPGDSAEIHLARSNLIARGPLPGPAVMVVTGPDAYISPDWYGAADQVPTWNYVAVHLRGVLEPLGADELRGLVDRLTAEFEGRLAPKAAWRSDKMTEGAMDRMLRMIVPFRLRILTVESTWKLGQNKTAAMRAGVVHALQTQGETGAGAIAGLMQDLT